MNARISIVCTTYNHDHHIRDALNGFELQRCLWPFELILHDDASTDATPARCREYATTRQHVRLILQNQNQWALGLSAMLLSIRHCSGEYIAFCEGDDYWTASDKLQVQCDALDANSDLVGVFHAVDDRQEPAGTINPGYWHPDGERPTYGLADLMNLGNFAMTSSLMIRKSAVEHLESLGADAPHTDFRLVLAGCLRGEFGYMPRAMSVYRRHSQGFHSTTWGARSALAALRTLIFGSFAEFASDPFPGLSSSVRWRIGELEKSIAQLENRNVELTGELERLGKLISEMSDSRTMRYGRRFSRIREAIRRLIRTT